MSVLDMLRTVQLTPSTDSKRSAGARDAAARASLQRALQSAAITIPQLLRERAALHGDRLALREKEYGIWNRYSWRHYYETARAVALGLLSLGIKPGCRRGRHRRSALRFRLLPAALPCRRALLLGSDAARARRHR
jgi:long-chain acyl-CoA synthetase